MKKMISKKPKLSIIAAVYNLEKYIKNHIAVVDKDYDELIDIIITTKQIDYYESAKIYKVVVDLILQTLRKDDYLRDRMTVISFMHKYNSDNTLQLGELLLSFKTTERFNDSAFDYDDEKWVYDIICSIKGYVGEEDGEEERRKERS